MPAYDRLLMLLVFTPLCLRPPELSHRPEVEGGRDIFVQSSTVLEVMLALSLLASPDWVEASWSGSAAWTLLPVGGIFTRCWPCWRPPAGWRLLYSPRNILPICGGATATISSGLPPWGEPWVFPLGGSVYHLCFL